MASDPLYEDALSYRSYRLMNTSQTRSSRATGKVRDISKRLDVKLKRYHFDGEDPIRIIIFLRRFVEEAENHLMSEAQAFLAFPDFLEGVALSQFEAIADSVDPYNGGVTCWPEAVDFLLRSFASSTAVGEALTSLDEVKQFPREMETAYSRRINEAVNRCGNVHLSEHLIRQFLKVNDPAIKTIVERHHGAFRNATFPELVQFARAEGDAYRARTRREVTHSVPRTESPPTSRDSPVPQGLGITRQIDNV